MSTEFYKLKLPFTELNATPVYVTGEPRYRLTVHINHEFSGELFISEDDLSSVLLALTDKTKPAVIRAARADGPEIIVQDTVLPNELLVSEYGDLTTLDEVRNSAPVV